MVMAAAGITDTEQPPVVWSAEHRNALAESAQEWMERVGVIVLPVIPIELPAERWPKTNRKTGEAVRDVDGKAQPLFPGKAPSYWDPRTGQPKLYQRNAITEGTRRPPTQADVLQLLREPVTVGPAAEFGSPIGFCILTTEQLVVVDLDVTEANEQLLQRASAARQYIETSPSGGLHLVTTPLDAMASWASGKGYYTKWALEADGAAVGEVLSKGKVCLMAPTMRGDGKAYHLMPGQSKEEATIVEVPTLTDGLGIYPTASKAKRERAPKAEQPKAKGLKPVRGDVGAVLGNQLPELQQMLGQKAQGLLQGDLTAYGDAADRSATLAGFAKEAFGVENWLRDQGHSYLGTADELIAKAIDALGCLDGEHDEPIADKADRILDTIDPASCDGCQGDDSKLRSRYRFLSGGVRFGGKQLGGQRVNPCDAEAQADAGSQERPPFVMRGYTADALVIAVEETGLEVAVSTTKLSKATLLPLAPMEWWQGNYPRVDKEGNLIGIRWDDAADDLLRLRSSHSVYDPTRIRGLGVWLDEGRVVVHCGGELLVDGVSVPFAHHLSKHLYVKCPPLLGPAAEEPTADELQLVRDLVKRWNFADTTGSLYVLGWVVTSMLSGALEWRPGLWVTGPTEAGKSSLMDQVVLPLVRAVGGRKHGADTTAAGIRQSLGHNAVPVLIDEMESDSDTDRRRVDAIIQLQRSSSSNDGAEVAKGSSSGIAVSYLVRSSLLFASINLGLDKAQDKNRTEVVRLLPLTDEQRKAEPETRALWKQVTEGLGQKVMRRALRLMPQLLHNAEQLEMAVKELRPSNSARLAKVDGLLLAGAGVFADWGEECLTQERAHALAQAALGAEAAEEPTNEEHSDAAQCLQHLLLHRIEVAQEVGSGGYSRRERVSITVQEALGHYMRPRNIDIDEMCAELMRNGLKVAEYQGDSVLMVANGHKGVQKIFERTQWRSFKETLLRQGADGIATATQSFGGRAHKHRCVRFLVSALVDEADLPRAKPKPWEAMAA